MSNRNRHTNKGEGPVGLWKAGLVRELTNLEENLDHLYSMVGLQTNPIIGKVETNGISDPKNYNKTNEEKPESYQYIAIDYLDRVDFSVKNICGLIEDPHEFDLPIPVNVLLKMAAKIGLIRWKDYKKKPNGLMKNYVYSLSPYLIQININLFKSVVEVLGTNIIPFVPFINRTIAKILEWTRSSNLLQRNEAHYHLVRVQQFKMISLMIEQLSLNINLEPLILKTLFEVELVGNLEELVLAASSEQVSLKDKHMLAALQCLEKLSLTYANLLDAPLEQKVKNYVIQTCVSIYRNFDSNVIRHECRKQLLLLLETLAHQPYSSSTTEIAYHVFELAEKQEKESDLKSLARELRRKGLAHRPTIVSHHDVYNLFGKPMTTLSEETDLASEKDVGDSKALEENNKEPNNPGDPTTDDSHPTTSQAKIGGQLEEIVTEKSGEDRERSDGSYHSAKNDTSSESDGLLTNNVNKIAASGEAVQIGGEGDQEVVILDEKMNTSQTGSSPNKPEPNESLKVAKAKEVVIDLDGDDERTRKDDKTNGNGNSNGASDELLSSLGFQDILAAEVSFNKAAE